MAVLRLAFAAVVLLVLAVPTALRAETAEAPDRAAAAAPPPGWQQSEAFAKGGIVARSKAATQGLGGRISAATRRLFERAAAAFPSFCQDWEHKLRERERNNLSSIKWQDKGGWKIGRYLGYSKILSCKCKQSTHGQPVGTLNYSEVDYYLAGRTVEEAEQAPPKPVGTTDTTEIFRWDQDHWAY